MNFDLSKRSPNHSSREGTAIDMLVLHATAGSYASALAELCNPKPNNPDDRVSAHYLVRKDGHIAWLVDDSRAAWHAGVSSWLHRDSAEIQRSSIGIEIENANTGRDPYPPAQLAALAELCRHLIARYDINRMMVVRHLDIAKGRKTDPAGLPWPAFRDALYAGPVAYRVQGLPVFQRSDLTGPVVTYLQADTPVIIDAHAPLPGYAPTAGHIILADGSTPGFVDMQGLKIV